MSNEDAAVTSTNKLELAGASPVREVSTEQRLHDDAAAFREEAGSLDVEAFAEKALEAIGAGVTPKRREAKQVIVIRRDLKMRRGKEIAQGAHASTAWLAKRLCKWGAPGRIDDRLSSLTPYMAVGFFSEAELAWLTGRFTKVTCQAASLEELLAVEARAGELGIECRVITDAGLTEFGGVPTVTCLAVGPDWSDRVDEVTGKLRLY